MPASASFGSPPRIDIKLFTDGEALSSAYRAAAPFPHIVLDGRFPEEVLSAVAGEVSDSQIPAEPNFYGSFLKRRMSDIRKMGPATRAFVEDLNSAHFIEFLEALTGIPGLIPDPHLEGGGVHQMGPGGFLKVHTDFNWHGRLRLHRRLNVLVYLNREWKESWNGDLELWNDTVSECGLRVAPIMNRIVVFSTTDKSYHGHPDKLACPQGVTRDSIALYYYSAERPIDEVHFGPSQLTNYRERPDERFTGGKGRHFVHQLLIRCPSLRKLFR